MSFEPIAIVGRGCVLPDALSPDEFWDNIAEGRLSVSTVPDGHWRLPHRWMMGTVDEHLDRTWTDVGGYVRGFESVFDPSGFLVDAEQILGLDPLFHWVLYAAQTALRESRQPSPWQRVGLVLGNLSYPTTLGSRYVEHVLLSSQEPAVRDALLPGNPPRPDARNRFSSGFPAHFAAVALGLGAGAFAVDAACASGLYAIKLACDRLHDGTADLMLAGAVNGADSLFLHSSFSALRAISRTGRSRPFHRQADGLVPAEGAGFVALMRLRDALLADAPIFGVIRAIGLSNDGHGSGLLVPAEEGQERAMRLAYTKAGISPDTVSLVECHATGTLTGDTVEVHAMARAFAGCADLPIGSAKSNVGHLLAAAGIGGLLKVLGAMRAGVRPATLNADEPIDALDGTPLRVLAEPEDWPGLRRAAVSAFGFGGANAHIVVDAWNDTQGSDALEPPIPTAGRRPDPIAIVAIGARVADGSDAEEFRRAVLRDRPQSTHRTTVDVALSGLRFPLPELEQALPQHILVMEAAREAVYGLKLPRERTMVLIGMGVEPTVARIGARWRVAFWLEENGIATDPDRLARLRNAFLPPMSAAHVVGSLPNLVANRINTQLDLAGPGFTVSAEEASGLVALDLAARAIRSDEADAAVVGAVDLSHDPLHQAALRDLDRHCTPGDAAIVLVVKRLSHARRDGDQVIALLDDAPDGEPDLIIGDDGGDDTEEAIRFDPAELFGAAHAAKGLVAVAVAATALQHRVMPRLEAPACPMVGMRTAEVVVSPLGGPPMRACLRAGTARPWMDGPTPSLHVFSGRNREEVVSALTSGYESSAGPARLVVLDSGDEEQPRRLELARRWLVEGGIRPAGIAYRDGPLAGEIGFVFTNGAAAYPGMGHELALAFPASVDKVSLRMPRADTSHVRSGQREGPSGVLEQIWGTALLSAFHVELSRGLLGLRPNAVIGYSSGESAALAAMGAWTDIAALRADTWASDLFTTEVAGEYRAIRRVWERLGIRGDRWASYLVNLPAERIRGALTGERAVHLMTINAPDVCVIGGEAAACAAFLERLGDGLAVLIDYGIAAHAPELAEVRDQWWDFHHRPTTEVPGVRFYSCATAEWYVPTAERAADELTAQALGTIDFVAVVERAWADGVRVFIEHGPQGLCTAWIRRILTDRDHLAVALDAPGGKGVRQLCFAVTELVAAGVPVQAQELFDHLATAVSARADCGEVIRLPAHPAELRLPSLEPPPMTMRHAPRLPPVLHQSALELGGTPVTPRAEVVPAQNAEYTGVLAAVARQRQRVTVAHRDFLARHAEAHQAFLRTRGQAVAAFVRTALETREHRPPTVPEAAVLVGPTFDRAQLEHLASQRISELFGPRFASQDGYARQTRLPQPPMLLVDRVIGIDAEPASMGTGVIWTETDVALDSWYLDPCGRMPPGILMEAGQAHLLLLSWLGIDLVNRGERVYRLLGCEVTYHGSPPFPGETLRYEIHIDGHTEQGDVPLCFFHADCYVGDELRLTVRNGQAGFFTDAELAAADGVRWDPPQDLPATDTPYDPPAVARTASCFDAEAVHAFADGRPADCFGAGWEATKAHVRTPRIDNGRMRLLHEVTNFDPSGGPWGRGYLRAETPVLPGAWFFDGHVTNDPCMPGTLMFEGCLQAMSFYLAAIGFTIEHDGWRFEPVLGQPSTMRLRGQVTPRSGWLVYEVFVSEVVAGPKPTLYADVLCSVDGVKVLHAKRVGMRLVPDWPLAHWRQLGPPVVQTTGRPLPLAVLGGLRGYREHGQVAEIEGIRLDYPNLLACAWGRLSEVFGSAYSSFDGPRRGARLPGPPYHFMTRIISIDGQQGCMRTGSRVVAEYDVPDDVWYFEQNGNPTMPFAVLMEVAMQPCGWLAAYVGNASQVETDLFFRNLDGIGTLHAEVRPGTRALRTHVELSNVVVHERAVIESFTVECLADGELVFELSAVFGFFPLEAFDHQVGLPPSESERARLAEPCGRTVDLTARPDQYCAGSLQLAGSMLLMLDRITGYWPEGGKAGLGRLRAEKDIDAGEWFFKAHFFQDPVQPGSLGVEAMCQLLQFFMIERNMAAGLRRPRFEPVLLGSKVIWKYRGQVVPTDQRITIEMEIAEIGEDARGRHAIAEAWLWVDGRRIYHVRNLGMRIVSDNQPSPVSEELLDPAVDTWLVDHRPIWTVPVLPMMSIVDRLAKAVTDYTGQDVVTMRGIQLRRWVPVGEPVRLRTEVEPAPDGFAVKLLMWRDAATAALSRFEVVATGVMRTGTPPIRPRPLAPLPDAVAQPDPYTSGAMFHGPCFHYVVSLKTGSTGSSGVLDAARGSVPRGQLHQGLLDAALHVIPSQELWRWSPEIGRDQVAFPHRITTLELFEPLPDTGEVLVEARFAGFDEDNPLLPAVDLQLIADGRVLVAMRLTEVLIWLRGLAGVSLADRRAFFRDLRYTGGFGLSMTANEVTVLSVEYLDGWDGVSGAVARLYGLPSRARGRDHIRQIAIKDHVARLLQVHPSAVEVSEDLRSAHLVTRPEERCSVDVEQDGDKVTVRSAGR
jgi:acyl transferase domain-containing protein/3-hydroxymyristoyl/3-hydroxydecanoyl-(acyl carrier protein) dehydratase